MNRRITLAISALTVVAFLAGCHLLRPSPGRGEPPPREEVEPEAAAAPRAEAEAEVVEGKRPPFPEAEGRVVLLTAFAWSEGPADYIARAFSYAARQAFPPFIVEAIRCASAFEATIACDSVMQSGGVRLVVFAGDEGPAAAVALLSAKHRVPVLKLTSDARSYTAISPYVFEFLAGGERQAEFLARFATRTLRLEQLMILNPADTRGRILAASFRSGVERSGGRVAEALGYEPETQNVRPELAAMFSSEWRLASGRLPLAAALTPEERTEAFGDSQRGEVLFMGRNDSTSPPPRFGEGLFFVVSPEKAESYAGQLALLPPGTALLGNSSWVSAGVLAGEHAGVEGMHVVVPLLPEPGQRDALLSGYEAEAGREANEWELLGLDAGDFVGRVMASPRAKQDWAKVIPQMPRFAGRAVEVDFGGAHENHVAKILRFENGELVTVP